MRRRKGSIDLDGLTDAVKLYKSPTTPTRKRDLLFGSYANDPVAFATDILGIAITDYQAQQLRAIQAHERVAVAAGHRTGRTMAFACALLWWCSTRHGARALLSTPSHAHLRSTCWRQLRDLIHGATQPLECEWFEMPTHGIQFKNGAEIKGLASDSGEKLQGYAAAHILLVVDEAAGYPAHLFQSLMSNLAGGGRALIGGNPTRSTGVLVDAFKNPAFTTMHISALDVARSGVDLPGLATQAWCDEVREEWGEDSAVYCARVLGRFPKQEENVVITLDLVESAVARWKDAPTTGALFDALGPLEIGCDPARFGADETVIIARRGTVALSPKVYRKLDGAQVAAKVMELVTKLRRVDERPVVRVDSIGIGASVVDHLRPHTSIRTIAINVSEVPNDATNYARRRDEQWFVLRDWLKAGGCIPPDPKLEGDLSCPQYSFSPAGKLVVEGKDAMRARIKRSPDRADALALAVYDTGAKNTRFTPTTLLRGPYARRLATGPVDEWGRPLRSAA